jgi:hypothetical protein
MATFTTAQIGLSYPKPRNVQTKVIPIARTDSSTLKCVLPKNACIVGVHVYQNVNAATAAATFNLGWSGATTAIINGFSMATTAVGLTNPGTATGSGIFTPLTEDKRVIATYTVGSSTAGGTGYVTIEYFVPGPGEGVDD